MATDQTYEESATEEQIAMESIKSRVEIFGILAGALLTLAIVSFSINIFSLTKGNTDLNIFLWMTSICAIPLCLLDIIYCLGGSYAIYKNDYKVLLACSSLVAICGIMVYFLLGLFYAFCVIMTAYVMEDHPEIVNICLLVTLGLGFLRFFIFIGTLVLGLMTAYKTAEIDCKNQLKNYLN